MNQYQDVYAAPASVASQPIETRAQFIRKTYYHLAGAIGVFTAMLYGIVHYCIATNKVEAILKVTSGWGWLVVLGVFMLTSWIADSWARSATSKAKQYAGLTLYTFAQALIFTPLILIVFYRLGIGASLDLLKNAGIITVALFGGISFIALTTKKDFSFLGGVLKIGGFIAMGVIAVSLIGGLNLGVWFSVIMCLFAGASILYNTSNMIHHYRTDQYVSASLGLFSSFALLLWYVIRILMSMSSSD